MNNDPPKKEGSTLSLIQQLKDKKRAPSSLSKEERQRCVEIFWINEGRPNHWMAEVLDCSEKTIRRDKREIHSRHALVLSKNFAAQFIGLFITRSHNHLDELIRIANSKDATNDEKIKARGTAFRIHAELFEKLQSLDLLALQNKLSTNDMSNEALTINVMPTAGGKEVNDQVSSTA